MLERERAGFPFRRRASVALFFASFVFYLLSTSREDTWADARPIFEVAESIVERGELSIGTRWPGSLPLGHDGKVYAVAPLLQSAVHVPGAAIKWLVAKQWPEAAGHAKRSVCHLASAALAALALVFLMGICRDLGMRRGPAMVTVAGAAVASILWVYARYAYSEALQAACFTGFFRWLVAAERGPSRRNALTLGVFAGLLLSSKFSYAVSLAGAALFLIVRFRRDRGALLRLLGWASLAGAPFVLAIVWYNQVRWGALMATGYDVQKGMGENPLYGLWGLLLSPGKSIFLYSPPLLLSAVALPRFLRRHGDAGWAMLATVGPVVGLTVPLLYWSGDFAWGPRYIVFAIPVLCLPAGELVSDLFELGGWRRRTSAVLVAGVLAAGAFVQVIGNAFYWDHFIRIQREARIRWLGPANVSGSPFADPWGECGPCFEDLHGMQWLPPFQPIAGHTWLLRHVAAGHDWVAAERDAPWRRYTSLQLHIGATYQRAHIDWWYLQYRGTKYQAVGLSLLLGLLGGFLVALGWLVFEVRRR